MRNFFFQGTVRNELLIGDTGNQKCRIESWSPKTGRGYIHQENNQRRFDKIPQPDEQISRIHYLLPIVLISCTLLNILLKKIRYTFLKSTRSPEDQKDCKSFEFLASKYSTKNGERLTKLFVDRLASGACPTENIHEPFPVIDYGHRWDDDRWVSQLTIRSGPRLFSKSHRKYPLCQTGGWPVKLVVYNEYHKKKKI